MNEMTNYTASCRLWLDVGGRGHEITVNIFGNGGKGETARLRLNEACLEMSVDAEIPVREALHIIRNVISGEGTSEDRLKAIIGVMKRIDGLPARQQAALAEFFKKANEEQGVTG